MTISISCLLEGMDDYLTKPIDRNKLIDVLTRMGRPGTVDEVPTAF